MFSKACEYAIKAAVFIATQSLLDKKVSLKDVAKAIESPEAYTSKILQQLGRSLIINSDKGPTGGFSMDSQQLEQITLSTIVMAIDGNQIYQGCGLGLRKCSEVTPCPVHHQFKNVREQLKHLLESTHVKSLAMDVKIGAAFLK